MVTVSPDPHFYKVGGSLGFAHPSYVTRQADHDLLTALRHRQFCYVFNCRQMGKSSLRVRTMRLLGQDGTLCAAVDMTMLGSYINPQQWYGGLITQLFQGFNLFGAVNLKTWLREQQRLSPVQQLSQFMTEIVLPHTGDRPLFIFIDEIDKILSLDFAVDDFFALIRFFYNQRAENPIFNRVTFALFGVATPSDLIQDKTQTLFNIGQAIELKGFTLEEVGPLAVGLSAHCDRPDRVLQEILTWTGGQPFLTQKLCQLILKVKHPIPLGQEAASLQTLVRSQIIEDWETQDEPVHFKTIRDRLLRHPPQIARQLGFYKRILEKTDVRSAISSVATELRLSGLVVQREGCLQVYNRIYAEIFDVTWIEQQLAQIRPYAESITAWESSNRQDESRLLRGKALSEALQWSASKNLSRSDYQFLAASQALDKQTALAQERRRQDVERLELELVAEQKAKAELSQAYATAKRRLRLASVILVASAVGAAIATGWLGYVLRREQVTQVESLEWAGKGALSQFEFSQIDALLTAMEAGEQLHSLMSDDQPLQDYPTSAPLTALQTILDRIQERNHLVGHEAPVNSVSVSPNGQFIATGSRDGTSKVWTIDGSEIQTLAPQNGDIYGVSFSPDSQKIVTGSNDGTVKVWSIGGKLLTTLEHPSDVYSVKFSGNGQWIATAALDGIARLWTSDGEEIQRFRGHLQAIYSVDFSPDSDQILTASRDGTAKVWQLDGTLVRSLPSREALYSASFSPDGQRVVTAGKSGIVEIWNGNSLEQQLKGHQGAIYKASFDSTGEFLATTSADETVKIWSMTGHPVLTLQGYQGAVYDASFNPQNSVLVTASHEKDVKVWDFSQFSLMKQMPNQSEVAALRLGHNGLLVTAFSEGRVMLQSQTHELLSDFNASSSLIYDIAVHPSRDLMVIAFKDGNVELRNFQGKRLKQFRAHEDIIYSVAFHPQGNVFATGARDKTVKLWNLEGELQKTLSAHQDAVYDVQFSPNGEYLATASNDETAKVWTLDGQLQSRLEGHQGAIHQVEFSPDGQQLVTASTDETARLWNQSGEEVLKLEHHSGLIFRAGFSVDGQTIATGSKDGTISIWDLDGRLRDQLNSHQSLVMDLLFTAENQLISIAQEDEYAKIWPQFSSVSRRLEYLLNDGCRWLQDYFKTRAQRQPKICRSETSSLR